MSKIVESFRKSILKNIKLKALHQDTHGKVTTYRVKTPFKYNNGEEIHIELIDKNGEYYFTDQGYTLIHLNFNKNYVQPSDYMIQDTVCVYDVLFEYDILSRTVENKETDDLGIALVDLIAAILTLVYETNS